MEVQSVVVTQHCVHSELIPSLSSAPGIHNTFSAADKAACLCAMAIGSAEETRGEKTAVALLAVLQCNTGSRTGPRAMVYWGQLQML